MPKDPKYIDTPAKVNYSLRMEKELLEDVKRIAQNLNTTAPEVIQNILKDYFKNKVTNNTGVTIKDEFIIKLPYNETVKEILTYNGGTKYNLKDLYRNSNLKKIIEDNITPRQIKLNEKGKIRRIDIDNGTNTAVNDTKKNIDYYAFGIYKVNKIPNNLDKFSEELKTYTYNGGHRGVEILVLDELAPYLRRLETIEIYDDKTEALIKDGADIPAGTKPVDLVTTVKHDFIKCLYVLYFKQDRYNKLETYLIEPAEAINLLTKARNENVLLDLEFIIEVLEDPKTTLKDVKDYAEIVRTGNLTHIKKRYYNK